MLINTPVSLGEVIDKVTILEIKSEQISDQEKLVNIRTELRHLNETVQKSLSEAQLKELEEPKSRLRDINQQLWNIEDDIRQCERESRFDEQFIELARSVYFTNDRRSEVKKEINLAFGSELIEEKSYQAY